MTKIRFIAEKGNKGPDNVTILVAGMEDLPKYMMVTAEDFVSPIGTAKAFIENNVLMIEAELREEDFRLFPAIGFDCLEEEITENDIVVKRSTLQNIFLQEGPNVDPEILSISGQLGSGEALLMYY